MQLDEQLIGLAVDEHRLDLDPGQRRLDLCGDRCPRQPRRTDARPQTHAHLRRAELEIVG